MKSDNKYSPNQVLTNKQIDILTAPNSTWKGGVVVAETDFETSGKVKTGTVNLKSGVMRDLEVLSKEGLKVAQSKDYGVKLGKNELDDFHL